MTHRETKEDREKRSTALVAYLGDRKDNLVQWAQGDDRARALLRTAVYLARKDDNLAKCEPVSIFTSLVALCQMGLDLNPVRGTAYLVPFGNVCTPIPGYKGLVNLAQRSGIHPRAALVYSADQFRIVKGTTESVEHIPAMLAQDRGQVVGGYAVAEVCGHTDVLVMRLDELERVRQQAKRGHRESSAWRDHTEAMYRKTLYRRLCATLPLDDGAILAQHVDAVLSARRIRDYHEAITEGPRAGIAELPPDVKDDLGQVIDVAEAGEVEGEVDAWRAAIWDTEDVDVLQEMRRSPDWHSMPESVLARVKQLWEEQLKKAMGAKGRRPDPAL